MRKKSELYETQQIDIINQLIAILELDAEDSITLYELENDPDKVGKIMKLVPEIRKYFVFSRIIGAYEPDQVKRPWLSIIKLITKTQYRLFKSDYRIPTGDGGVVRTKKYTFIKK